MEAIEFVRDDLETGHFPTYCPYGCMVEEHKLCPHGCKAMYLVNESQEINE
jgi:hypothetical protein